MGIISDVTKRLEVPDDAEHHIEIRMVSYLTLDKARKVREPELIAAAKAAAGLDVVQLAKEVAQLPGGTAPKRDRLTYYDKQTLLKHGVVGWSYPGGVDTDKFDLPTAEWAAREVLDYSLPTEAQSKAASSPSTGT